MDQIDIFNRNFPNLTILPFGIPAVLEAIMPLDFQDYRLYYCKAACLHRQNKDKYVAKENIEKAIGMMGCRIETVQLNNPSIRNIHLLAAEIYSEIGDNNAAIFHYNKYYYYSYIDPGKAFDLTCLNTVYSFRKINEHSIHDLLYKEITVVPPSKMNDPFDSIVSFLANNGYLNKVCNKKAHIKNQISSINNFRIRSFVHYDGEKPFMPNDNVLSNTLMWSHYADSHKGFCIRYDLSDLFVKKFLNNNEKMQFSILQAVEYSDEPIDIAKALDNRTTFALKKKCWEYEQEARLVTFDSSSKQDFIGLLLDEKSYVAEIIFGYKCSEDSINTIRSIMSGDNKVKYSRMCIEDSDIFSLVKKEI